MELHIRLHKGLKRGLPEHAFELRDDIWKGSLLKSSHGNLRSAPSASVIILAVYDVGENVLEIGDCV